MRENNGGAPLAVIVVAAGESRRFGPNKLFQRLGGRPVLDWSLSACERSRLVSSFVLVVSEATRARAERLVARREYRKLRAVCTGGRRRQDSVWNGLQAAAGAEWIGVHDAARPFLNDEIIGRVFTAAQISNAAIAAVSVKDTVKLVGPNGVVERTPSRSGLWAAQTPQIFRAASLVAAFHLNGDRDVTDDAELLECAGQPVAVVLGSYDNVKITTPEDLHLARAIARRLAAPHPLPPPLDREGAAEGGGAGKRNGNYARALSPSLKAGGDLGTVTPSAVLHPVDTSGARTDATPGSALAVEGGQGVGASLAPAYPVGRAGIVAQPGAVARRSRPGDFGRP